MIGPVLQNCSLSLAFTITPQESCGAQPHFTDANVEGQRSEVRPASEKRETSNEGDPWGGSFKEVEAGAGLGPHAAPCGSLQGLGGGCQPQGLAAPRCLARGGARGGCQPVCGRRAAAARRRRSSHHPLACVRPGSPELASPGSAGHEAVAATGTVHAPAAGAGAPRESQATSHGARARGNAVDTGWQCHREPTVTAPRLTVAAPR